MNNQNVSDGGLQSMMLAAIRYILRPLIRFMLQKGITFQVFCDLTKSVYVKVAEDEFRLDSKEQTDSRISLLTGIHRREVNRLRTEPEAVIGLSQRASMSALLLTIWSGDAKYADRDGKPVPLRRLANKTDSPSFEALVQSVSKDFRPRVVLDEWLRQGIVTLDEEDRLHLVVEAFAQPQDVEEKLYYFGQNIHDHLAVAVHNIAGSEEPFLERCVFYDKLDAGSVKELAEYSRTISMKALHDINKRAAVLQKRDQGKTGAIHRVNFGVYWFSEAEGFNGNATS